MKLHVWGVALLCSFLWIKEIAAQDVSPDPEANLRGFSLGFHTGSRGLGFDFRYIYGGEKTDWVLGLRAFGVKDSRESKIESQFQERGSRYVYGKLNRLMSVVPYVGTVSKVLTA